MSDAEKGKQPTQGRHVTSETKEEEEGLQIDFSTFIMSIATTVVVNLGLEPHPELGKIDVDLELAKHNIDILSMLEDKTRGNLSETETRLLRGLLYDLRMQFVQRARSAR